MNKADRYFNQGTKSSTINRDANVSAVYLYKKKSAFSLAELLMVIAIIGVLAIIAIPGLVAALTGSKKGLSVDVKESVNKAVTRFNQANYEMIVTAVAGSTAEELSIVRTLQYEDPIFPATGSPYLRQDWNPVASSSTGDYRLIWMGRVFKLLEPGQAGLGLKVTLDGQDYGTKYVHPAGFTLAGK